MTDRFYNVASDDLNMIYFLVSILIIEEKGMVILSLDLHDELIAYIMEADLDNAIQLIDSRAASHNYKEAITEILEPALYKIGKMWDRGEISLAQGYVSGKVAGIIMNKALEESSCLLEKPQKKVSLVIGNIEDDYYSLGRKMVANMLKLSGWNVYDLGNDVQAPDFVDKALEVNAPIICVSAMMYTTAMNIKKVREDIEGRGLSGKIQLAAGGAIFLFRPELLAEVGGDGTARNAFESPALMEKLYKKSLE